MANLLNIGTLLLLLWIQLPSAIAETKVIFGVPFDVDQIQTYEDGRVQVTVFGESSLVGPDRVDFEILDAYLSSNGPEKRPKLLSFSSTQLETLAINASANSNKLYASKALIVLAMHANYELARILSFDVRFQKTSGAIASYKEFLDISEKGIFSQSNSNNALQIGSSALAFLALNDAEWIKKYRNAVNSQLGNRGGADIKSSFSFSGRIVAKAKPLIIEKIAERALEMAIRQRVGGSVAASSAIQAGLSSLEFLYGENDSEARSLGHILQPLIQLSSAIQVDGIIEQLFAIEASSSELRNPIGQALKSRILELADLMVGRRDLNRVLLLVASVDYRERESEFSPIVRKVLERMKLSSSDSRASPTAQEVLLYFASADPRCRQLYIEVLQVRCLNLLEEGELSKLPPYWSSLQELNPDPSQINDQIRYKIVETALRTDSSALQLPFVYEAKDKLSKFARFRLRTQAASGSLTLLWALLGFLCLLTLILILRIIRSKLRPTQNINKRVGLYTPGPTFKDEDLNNERSSIGPFVKLSGSRATDPRFAEYEACLKVLGLKTGATADEIKRAYRRQVKEAHPDAQKGDSQRLDANFETGNSPTDLLASEGFIRLQQSYERLMAFDKDGFSRKFNSKG